MEEVDSRFLHLLQPIRDLTKNWEVDVAAQLGEYLEELEHICISFDNGKTTMNFMEAALLIQGSACIYSKKVEYLYMLVCQTLDCISNKKREKLPTSLDPDGRDADATFTDREEEFLSLDDIPETSQASVDMRRDQQPAAVNIVPLTPMSLVPPEEGEKKENPLLSRRGEVLASRRDFRMNTSTPHASGAFLLELAGLSPTHPQQEQHLGTATGTWGPLGCHCHCHCRCQELTCPCPLQQLRNPLASLPVPTPPGAAGPDDDDVPGMLGDDMEVTPVPNEHIQAQRSTPRTRGYILRERPPSQDPKPHSKEEPNPWQSLDPFGDSEDKPFRKGRPFLVPHGLEDTVGGKRKRRGPRKLQDFIRWFSAGLVCLGGSFCFGGRRGATPNPVPTPADLEVLYWRQFKERMAAHRKLQNRGVSGLGAELGGLGGSSSPFPRSGGAQGCSFPQEPLWEQEQERGADCEEGADDDFVEHEDVDHEDMEPEALEELGEGSLGELLPSQIPSALSELFMASSQKFAQETELSQRIRLWEERMEPLLQEQAGTPRMGWDPQGGIEPPGVRAYGQSLTQRCSEPGRWHSLASLVAGQPPFEVCRYLLASLQLANDAEVELAQEPGLEEAVDTARLRLLSARPAHERFENFQLPSQRD
ncbi:CNDH2 protein, partial [Sylvia atricapilla]|nr:CNDH2 protein [Sylvia atricapilla]